MFGLGPLEIGIIVLVIAILFFGHNRIAGFARSLGRFGGEYKKSKREIEEELKRGEEEVNASAAEAQPQAPTAQQEENKEESKTKKK